MKKSFFLSLIVASACCLSCQGHTNNDASNKIQAENTVEEANIEMTPNEVVTTPKYEIENGKIIPKGNRPMIVDFSATWCPPCQKLKPIFAELAEEFRGRIDFLTIDVDNSPEIAHVYSVSSIPMLVFLDKEGQIQNTIIGFQNRDQLLAAINTYYGF